MAGVVSPSGSTVTAPSGPLSFADVLAYVFQLANRGLHSKSGPDTGRRAGHGYPLQMVSPDHTFRL